MVGGEFYLSMYSSPKDMG